MLFVSRNYRNAGVHSCAVVEFAEAAFKVLGVQPTGSVTANQPGALSSTWWVFSALMPALCRLASLSVHGQSTKQVGELGELSMHVMHACTCSCWSRPWPA